MRLLSIVWVTLLFAVSCASDPPPRSAWTRPGSDAQELESARQACLSKAADLQAQETSERLNARIAGNRFVDCMEERGWKRVAAP